MGIRHLHNLGAILCVLLLAACTTLGQFSHKKPWPTYSLQNMPQTRFTCHDKILGGYYADPETQCQMFHVCVKVAGVGVQDFRFLCPNGTAFDQEAQICADWGDVDCEQAVLYYGSDNFDLYRIGSGFESKRAPLAEEEEATFHLQRAETGDIRRSKETRVDQKLRPESQSYTKKYDSTTRNPFYEGNAENRKSNYDQNNDFNRVTQRFEAPKKTTSSYYTTPRGNDFHSNADSKQDADDLFKGSHSSNFFSNRNGGREDDFYESKPAATTTTTTSRPYNPPNQFFNGNGPQSDFSEFNKIPDVSTKRPHRGRRPIPSQNSPNSLISNPTSKSNPPSTTYATTVPDIPKSTKRLTLQTSLNTGFNFGNDQFYRPTASSSSSSTSTTTSTTTQRTSSTAQKYTFGTNDYQQNIQPTTYSPSGAFRYKSTTSKYDDINETALRGEKPGQSTFFNSQYENQNFEVFNRVSNRKSQNTERNIQKQQAKNTTLANRNEFTDFTKNKTPSGFQVPSRAQQAQGNVPQSPINPGLNVQPLDPNKLNSELRNINQTQQPHRGRVPIGRFNDRQQAEPQYFRTRPQETPAPFAVPQAQQQQAQKQFDSKFNGSPQRESSRIKPESITGSVTNVESLPQPQQQQVSKPFDSSSNTYNSPQATRSRSEQRLGSGTLSDAQSQQASKPADTSFNGYNSPQREISRTRTEQRTGGVTNAEPQVQAQPQQHQIQNFNGYTPPQREASRTRSDQRTGGTSNTGSTSNRDSIPQSQSQQQQFDGYTNPHRDISRIRAEPRTRTITNPGPISTKEYLPKPQQLQPSNQFESNSNGYNSPQREISRTKAEPRTGTISNADLPTRDSFPQRDYNRIKSDFISTTSASILNATPSRGRGRINYKATTQHQGRSLDNFVQSTTSGVKKFSTLVPKDQYYPTTFKPTTYKKAFDQKPTKHVEPKSRGTPYTANTTPLASTTSQSFNTPDEDDGQYHPELYEVDYSGNNVTPTKRPAAQTPSYSEPSFISTPQQRPQTAPNAQTTRSPQAHLQSQQQTTFQKQTQKPQNNFQQQQQKYPLPASPTDLSDEEELFKTAHSLNLGAASINKLRADTLKTADKTPQQSSLNFGFDRSSYPPTISPAPQTAPSTTTWRPTTSFIATTTTVRTPTPSKKPKKSSSASKRPPHADADTSYDYAYYDSLSETPQEYPEYDVISEFRKTKNH